jgi:hypothetical protein
LDLLELGAQKTIYWASGVDTALAYKMLWLDFAFDRLPGKAKQLIKKFGHRQKHLFSASSLAVLHDPHVGTCYKSTQN